MSLSILLLIVSLILFVPLLVVIQRYGIDTVRRLYDDLCVKTAERWYSKGTISKRLRDDIVEKHGL